MIPARFAPLLFSLILSGLMTLLASGITTATAPATGESLAWRWLLLAWLPSWAAAFPAVMVLTPLTRRLVGALVAK